MSVDTAQLGAFLAAVLVLVGSPGPATLGLAAAGAAFGLRDSRRFLAGLLCGSALVIALVGSGVVSALLARPVVAPVLSGLAALYMAYLAYRIATAPALGNKGVETGVPGFIPGFLLAVTNPKAYAVFATLFAGFVVLPDQIVGSALIKGCLIMVLLTGIDLAWLYAGSALRRLFHDREASRRINAAFAVLLLLSVTLAVLL